MNAELYQDAEIERYQRYVAYCKRQNKKPVSFEVWLRTGGK